MHDDDEPSAGEGEVKNGKEKKTRTPKTPNASIIDRQLLEGPIVVCRRHQAMLLSDDVRNYLETHKNYEKTIKLYFHLSSGCTLKHQRVHEKPGSKKG